MLYDVENRLKQIEARNKVEEIINSIENGKDSEWIRNSLRVLRKIGPKLGVFTSCDVWTYLDGIGIIPPQEPRAMAAVITKAKSNGWIESTDMWRTSTRSVNHGRPVRVWRWKP